MHRLFLPQSVLDEWVVEEKVSLEGEVLTLSGVGHQLRLASAVRFLSECGGAGDDADLIGRVKDLEGLASLGGEHYADSVILGEAAYQVEEGFVATPIGTGAGEGDALGLERLFA